MPGMETRNVRYFYKGEWREFTSMRNRRGEPFTFTIELNVGERYIVWPFNPSARPKLRGRTCTFQWISVRGEWSQIKATVEFEDDGTRAMVDAYDLLTEEQWKMHQEWITEKP